jgi:diaminohydroxyphosphoribosylaminopyrimidine deaminase/5-amino-6-(5-phosphoribosylamino)uracil reductase
MSQQITDVRHMAEAVRLASRGLCTTAPNPRVGCVIAQGERVIARGFHRRAGEAHAEVEALRAAREPVRGATAYVTLEPCSHHGRTPPCAEALIEAGVSRVVAASLDPNPLVAGSGLERLRAAGIAVESGILGREAVALNPGFFKRMRTGLPWVRVKLAMSLDGRTAMADGSSRWITAEAARADVQRLRAQSCAIVTGVGTVLHDDPRLDVRIAIDGLAAPERQPLRVVLDSQLRTPPSARVIGEAGDTLVVTAARDAAREQALREAGVTVLHLPDRDGRVDLRALLAHLAVAQCNEVLIEAGATLAGAALRAGLVDELVIYMAPTLMGSAARALLDLPLASMDEKLALQITDLTAVGRDWRITAIVAQAPV